MKNILCLLLSLLATPLLHAQDSIRSEKSISFDQGFTYLVNKDLYRSPYVYKGINPYLGVTAEKRSLKSVHRISAGISFGSVKTSFSALSSNYLLNLDYTYLRKIVSAKRYNVYIGAQLGGFSWNINYFPEMDVPQYAKVHSYMLGGSLRLATEFNYTISPRSSLRLTLSAPVATYMDRPHFLNGSDRESRFGMFNYWNPQAKLTYEYKVSNKVSLQVSYQYQYMQYAYPKEFRMMGNGLTFGVKIKW